MVVTSKQEQMMTRFKVLQLIAANQKNLNQIEVFVRTQREKILKKRSATRRRNRAR
jgi:hypothetical protein